MPIVWENVPGKFDKNLYGKSGDVRLRIRYDPHHSYEYPPVTYYLELLTIYGWSEIDRLQIQMIRDRENHTSSRVPDISPWTHLKEKAEYFYGGKDLPIPVEVMDS